MAAQFQLVMRAGPAVGKVFPLEGNELTIGRDASNPISINDGEVSRRHASLSLHGSGYVLQDLGSTNGTFINGRRLTVPQVLNPGDTVAFGENISLTYEMAYDPNATMLGSSASRNATAVPMPRPGPTPAPVQRPAPMPTPYQAPPPQPTPVPYYSGQIPAGPVPLAPAPAKKKGGKAWIIILIVVLLVVCLCVISPILADALNMDCVVPFKWFFNIVGPLFGYGMCS